MKNLFANRIEGLKPSFIREILEVAASQEVISFAGGLPHPEQFPLQMIQEAMELVMKNHPEKALQYTSSKGIPELRELIAQRYNAQHQNKITAENILITNGSQQALDLIGKLFLNAHDDILMDKPGYLGAIQAFEMYQPNIVGTQLTSSGPSIHELQQQLKSIHPKFYYGVPYFNNPTGASYSEETKKEMSTLFQDNNMCFIEDNAYEAIWFESEGVTSMREYLPEHTISLGSFSKMLAPGLRLGWMIATEPIIQKLTLLKQGTDLQAGSLTQYIAFHVLQNDKLKEHMHQKRQFYRRQRDLFLQEIKQYFGNEINYTNPAGGMFLWLEAEEWLDSNELFQQCIKRNVAFVPGEYFYLDREIKHQWRMNFSNADKNEIKKGIKIIAEEYFKLKSKTRVIHNAS